MRFDLDVAHLAAIGSDMRTYQVVRAQMMPRRRVGRPVLRSVAVLEAERGYKPFRPVPLWVVLRPAVSDAAAAREHQEGTRGQQDEGLRKKAQRHKSDQANKRDSLIVNRFETIKAWVDFLNLNRKVEDDDEQAARKAAADADEMGIVDVDKRPATRLAFDLDLAPQDIARERLAGKHLYAEWDYRRAAYHGDHVRVLESPAELREEAEPFLANAARQRRIRAVRRQFEALRPRRMVRAGEFDGEEIDLEAVVRLLAELKAGHSGNERVFRRVINQARDLSVATLIDTSRSTESVVEERSVISTAQEALLALAHGLAATGDAHAMYAFSSLRRDRVFVSRLKAFEEPMGSEVEQRIASLRPGFYTRLGGAIRHVAGELSKRGATRRLLLVITDGKPNDLDHYEGKYGVEDTRKAVIEARMAGHAVFAITIDKKALAYVPHIFGRNGYAIVARPSHLAEALPQIYRHLVTS
jgi:nitric oxide reductase NorD protein